MTTQVKFTFDTHFDEAGREVKPAETRSRKSYSADEIEAIRREAREDGLKDGGVRATQAVAASVGQVAAAVLRALEAMDAEVEAMRKEAAALGFAAAKTLAGAALAAAPESEIEGALTMALHQAIGEPRVVVKTAPGLAGAIEKRAVEIAAQQGFEGRVQFAPDGALKGADCRIEWRGGGVERTQATIEAALQDLIARRFSRAADV